MDKDFARQMSEMTTDFYARTSVSFGATRQGAWPGWERLLVEACVAPSSSIRLLDVACGNLRFERFLAERVSRLETWAIDNCDDLVGTAPSDGLNVHYACQDVSEALLEEETSWSKHVPLCDLSVSFGFMHHLPLFSQRLLLLQELIRHTRPGGSVVVAFWQFAADERLRAKARPIEGGEGNDYLLGWQNKTDVARYCHFCNEDEIDLLVQGVLPLVQEAARFYADGRSGRLNRYVVLHVAEQSAAGTHFSGDS